MTFEPTSGDANIKLKALSLALEGKSISVLHQCPDARYDVVENLPAAWPASDILGKTDAETLPDDTPAGFAAELASIRETGKPSTFEFELREGTSRRRFEASATADSSAAGHPYPVTIVLVDVTEDRSREAAMTNLLREVSHRSKNLLAIVQSVATQTAHHSDNIEDFLDKFRGRLQALSNTQDMVTESEWRGTYFQSLVTAQLSRVGPAIANLRLTGANPLLGPNASLHIGLAMHELAANAVIHGALSHEGNVWVDAHFEGFDGGRQLVIEWQETGVEAAQPQPRRFGSMVLERIVPLSVGGTARYSIDPDHVSYRLTVPADQFEG